MSNPIKAALANEIAKLGRQEENHAATLAVAEILGTDVKTQNKLDRQVQAMEDTKANIKKLETAVSKLK